MKIQHIAFMGLALGVLSLSSCRKSFDLESPLFPKDAAAEKASIVYFKKADLSLGNILSTQRISTRGGTVTDFPSTSFHVYLYNAPEEDITVSIKIDASDAAVSTFSKLRNDGLTYTAIPATALSLSTDKVTFKKGSMKSEEAVTVTAASGYSSFFLAQNPNTYALLTITAEVPAGNTKLRLSKDYGSLYYPFVIEGDNIRKVEASDVASLSEVSGLGVVTTVHPTPDPGDVLVDANLFDHNPATVFYSQYSSYDHTFMFYDPNGEELEVKGFYLIAPAKMAADEIELIAYDANYRATIIGDFTLVADTGAGTKNYYRLATPVKTAYLVLRAKRTTKDLFGFSEFHFLK